MLKPIVNFFKAVRSLGIYGFILFLGLVVIGWSVYEVVRLSTIIKQTYLLQDQKNYLEDLNYYLVGIDVWEQYYLMSGDEVALTTHQEEAGYIYEIFDELQALEDALEIVEMPTSLIEIQALYDEYETAYWTVIDAYKNDQQEEIWQLLDDNLAQSADLRSGIEFNISMINIAYEQSIIKSGQQVGRAMISAVTGLVILPFLAVWAFIYASRLTHPILSLTNAVLAISGNQFKPDMLADMIERQDSLGKYAQILLRLAQDIHRRQEILQREELDLHTQLSQLRRRKLMPSSPTKSVFDTDDYQMEV